MLRIVPEVHLQSWKKISKTYSICSYGSFYTVIFLEEIFSDYVHINISCC